MDEPLITSPAGVMTVLIAVASFWFWVERVTQALVASATPARRRRTSAARPRRRSSLPITARRWCRPRS